jgi:NAD(P)-dependent dehydrogenase (short-subunit alcohol dehydrogenase family)
MDMGIKDRVAMVTGAGRGIGRQICLTLSEEGAKVAVNDVFQERAEAVAEEIRQAGGQAMGVVADVTDLEAVTAMVSRIADEWGSLDILVNNAGIPVITSAEDATVAAGQFFSQSDRAQWDRTMGLITYSRVAPGPGREDHAPVSAGQGPQPAGPAGRYRRCRRLPGFPAGGVDHRPGAERQRRLLNGRLGPIGLNPPLDL